MSANPTAELPVIATAPADAHPLLTEMAGLCAVYGAALNRAGKVDAVIATFAGTNTVPDDAPAIVRVAAAMMRAYVDAVTDRGAEWAVRQGILTTGDTITDEDAKIARDVLAACDAYVAAPTMDGLRAIAALPDGLHPTEGLPVSAVNGLTIAMVMAADALTRGEHDNALTIVGDDMVTIGCDVLDVDAMLTTARDALTR